MTDLEKKAWDELVSSSRNQHYWDFVSKPVLAADAELTALREELERIRRRAGKEG